MRRYRTTPKDDTCLDPRWVNLPMGGVAGSSTYNYSKRNYCDRCQQGTGAFPVSWASSGQWNYNASGTDYCSCCDNIHSPTLKPTRLSSRVQISQQTPIRVQRMKAKYRNILDINRNIYNL